jgi:hypothetical protein
LSSPLGSRGFALLIETPPLSRRSEPPAQKRGSRRRRGPRCFNYQRATFSISATIATTNTCELAASRSQEPFGSSAPSIRGSAFAPHTRDSIQEAWKRVALLTLGSAEEPGLFDGDSHQLVRRAFARGRFGGQAGYAWLFTIAPSGISPCSTYRHRAMSSLRASATIPIRRSRLLPLPNRRWYHCVNALAG